jgi:hypothetical protein
MVCLTGKVRPGKLDLPNSATEPAAFNVQRRALQSGSQFAKLRGFRDFFPLHNFLQADKFSDDNH